MDSKFYDDGGILHDTTLATATWLRKNISILICIILPETKKFI